MKKTIGPGKLFYVLTLIVFLGQLIIPASSARAAGAQVIWCPAATDITTAYTGCTAKQTNIADLITAIGTDAKSGAGVIYLTSNYNIDDFSILYTDSNLANLTDLTIQGGWNDTLNTFPTDYGDKTIITKLVTIRWVHNIKLRNIQVQGLNGTSNPGVMPAITVEAADTNGTTKSNLDVRYVEAYSNNGKGASFDIFPFSAPYDAATGKVTAKDSYFGDSSLGNTGDGLRVTSTGDVEIVNVYSYYNRNGLYLSAYGSAVVQNSEFNNNTRGGITISNVAVSLELKNVQAKSNANGSGVAADSISGSVAVTDGEYSDNSQSGLSIVSTGASKNITFSNVKANHNSQYGAYLDNGGASGTGTISLTNSIFGDTTGTGNTLDGLYMAYINTATITGGKMNYNAGRGINLYSAEISDAHVTKMAITNNSLVGLDWASSGDLYIGDCDFSYLSNQDADNAVDVPYYQWVGCGGGGGSDPSISSIFPTTGPASGGTTVEIDGTNFASSVGVWFDNKKASNCQVTGTTKVVCKTPTHAAGPVTVYLYNTQTSYDSMNSAFTFTGGGGSGGGSSSKTSSSVLPNTGFAPRIVTKLPQQPAEKSYAKMRGLWLEIPSQKVLTQIVGVPAVDGNWDVTWLGKDAGWLNGTAFPTWTGNSVVTAHVTDANGKAGPFAGLSNLNYGEKIVIHLYGGKYTFEVRESRLVFPSMVTYALGHLEDHSYLTLITCQGYNFLANNYIFRHVVRAVLISVTPE